MHTALYRANAVFTAAATMLAAMAALAAVLDFGLPAGPGLVSARVVEVEGLQVRDTVRGRALPIGRLLLVAGRAGVAQMRARWKKTGVSLPADGIGS
jgi:hypothetical protein